MILLDKIIIGILCFFFLSGWLRGFLKSLIGPIAFLFCFISGVVFYDVNRNILMAVFIGTVGTIALAITLNVLFEIGMATVHKEFRGKVFPVSRILGSVINVLWQGNILFAIIILLSTLPVNDHKLDQMRDQIPQSKMMAFYYDNVVNKDNRIRALVKSLSTMRDPNEVALIADTREFQTFRSEPKVQKFINDPQVNDAFEHKNGWELVQTTSLHDLVTDDNAMYSFSKLAEMVYRKNLADLEGLTDKTKAP